MADIIKIAGVKIYVAKLGLNPSRKYTRNKVYVHYTKRAILPHEFPGNVAYVLSEEEFQKVLKILENCKRIGICREEDCK